MKTDCINFAKSFHDCQTHASLNHVPPSELYNMTSPWPFLVWGIDVIERIAPKASNGHMHILVAIDYFTKYRGSFLFHIEGQTCGPFHKEQHHLPV